MSYIYIYILLAGSPDRVHHQPSIRKAIGFVLDLNSDLNWLHESMRCLVRSAIDIARAWSSIEFVWFLFMFGKYTSSNVFLVLVFNWIPHLVGTLYGTCLQCWLWCWVSAKWFEGHLNAGKIAGSIEFYFAITDLSIVFSLFFSESLS